MWPRFGVYCLHCLHNWTSAMGYDKDRMIQEEDQGWRFRDGETICYRCVSDTYLREHVKSTASEFECTFCGRTSRKEPTGIPFNELMGVIGGAIWQYFDHAVNCMGWEGGYVGTTYDSYDLVRDEIPTPSENEEILSAIIDSLGDQIWCDLNPYALTGAERYASSWEQFCNTVKHKVRYFFDSKDNSDDYSETIPVPEMLEELRDIIDEAGLTASLPVGTQFFRVRPHKQDEVCDNWRSLGSPPAEASVSNRMSAAGISVFYAAMDLSTARAETTANLEPTDGRVLTVAIWTNSRPLNVLDLSRLPEIPSFYAQVRYDRDHLLFLRDFVESITEPVVHDGREHIEYVPPQIVTEYFRHRYRLHDKLSLDGIIYPSSQRKRGRSVVIFVSQADLNPDPHAWSGDSVPILALEPTSIRTLLRSRARPR
jgi:hypothetical protein